MIRAGTARADITPPIGVYLQGYAGRPGPSTGIHDSLEAQALVLESEGTRAAVVTADIISFDDETMQRVCEKAQQAGIAADSVLFSASHTHSGPTIRALSGMGDPDPGYLQRLADTIGRMVCEAASHVEPVRVAAGRSKVHIGVNRRQKTDRGIALGTEPSGPIDRELLVLRIDDASGQVKCILFNCACHGVVMGGDNLLISADWIGYARREVERRFPGVAGMFAQGACGDINPIERDTFEIAEKLGHQVADEVAAAAAQVETSPVQRLAAASVPFEMPLLPIPTLEEARKELRDATERVRSLEQRGAPVPERKAAGAIELWAKRLLAAAEKGEVPPMRSRVTAIALDGLALVGLPGEVLCEIGMNIKSRSPFPRTFVVAYANRVLGYIPTREAHAEGGYEVDGAYKYYGIAKVAPDAQDAIETAAAHALRLTRGG